MTLSQFSSTRVGLLTTKLPPSLSKPADSMVQKLDSVELITNKAGSRILASAGANQLVKHTVRTPSGGERKVINLVRRPAGQIRLIDRPNKPKLGRELEEDDDRLIFYGGMHTNHNFDQGLMVQPFRLNSS